MRIDFFRIKMWIKRIYNFYGNKNVLLDNVNNIEKALIISKVNKSKKANSIFGYNASFFVNVIIVEYLVWFVVSELIVGNLHLLRSFVLFTVFYVFSLLILQFVVRLKLLGDTIIFFEDKIVELNWLYSKEIYWSKVKNIYFYARSKRSAPKHLSEDVKGKIRNIYKKRLVDVDWINMKIKGADKTIYINTAYSHNEELQKYIKEKYRERAKSSTTEGFRIDQGAFVAIINGLILGPSNVGIVYLLNFIILHWHQIGFQWTLK